MHRFLGIMLFGAFALMGHRAAERLRQRRILMEQTALFLFSLKIETEYACQPFPALLQRLASQMREFDFLQSLNRYMQESEPMPLAFAAAAKQTQGYTAEERAQLSALGSVLGTTDKAGQIELLARALLWFQNREQLCAQQARQYGVLFRCAGIFAGAVAFIVLL